MQRIPSLDITPATASAPKRFAQVNGKFYVRLTEGYFQNLRRLISWPLLALFFATVWLTWDGQPLVLFSLAERRIVLFGHFLSLHDLPLLAGLLIAAATLLFAMAVAWGRVWCGFACPQSIWAWLFMRIEQWTEGSARARQKADEQGLSRNQWLRRISKHLLWLLLALATAITFTGYFVPVRDLASDLLQLNLMSSVWLWITIMAGLTYLNAGLVREKICLHACPYSRFQSVMFDADTRTVSYDAARGEPRAHLRHTQPSAGDCVDCRLCVQVCPTGIDIRDGLQPACIDCGACIDACDKVMNKLQRPTGLIRFASENQLHHIRSAMLRPRFIGYGLITVLAAVAVGMGFMHKTQLLTDVQRSRNALFIELPDGRFCNDFQIKLESFNPGINRVDIQVVSKKHGTVYEIEGPTPVDVQQFHAQWQSFRVCTDSAANSGHGREKIDFVFHYLDEIRHKSAVFFFGR